MIDRRGAADPPYLPAAAWPNKRGNRNATEKARWIALLSVAGASATIMAWGYGKRRARKTITSSRAVHKMPLAPDEGDKDPSLAQSLGRIEGSFGTVYMQLISIIQGLAFTTLAGVVVVNHSTLVASQWVRITAAFLFIVAAWQEYMVGSTLFSWVPTPLDSMVPFGLGAIEFAVITTTMTSLGSYLGITALLWAASLVAYTNYVYHAKRGFASNAPSRQLLRRYLRSGIFLTWFFAVLYIAIWLLYQTKHLDVPGGELAFAVITVAGPVVSILHFVRDWNGVIRRARDR